MKENETFLGWIGNNLATVLGIIGLTTVATLLLGEACSMPVKTFLVAGRVTIVQRAWTHTYKCGKYNTNECRTDYPPSVHFLYDGSHFHREVNSNSELQPFRHWGCYWLRMRTFAGARMISSVVGPAPDQACRN
jgi:hypothetical protein